MANLVQALEAEQMQRLNAKQVPDIRPGDTVRAHVRIVEGNRERVQVFEGIVLAFNGAGLNRSITVRRMGAHGVGVERIFPLYAPRVEKFEVVRRAIVRRAKLYFLRGRTGKQARLREKR